MSGRWLAGTGEVSKATEDFVARPESWESTWARNCRRNFRRCRRPQLAPGFTTKLGCRETASRSNLQKGPAKLLHLTRGWTYVAARACSPSVRMDCIPTKT